MIVQPNQSFSSYASGLIPPGLGTIFKENMDAVVYSMGRDVSINLKPAKSPCLAGCVFNSFYKKFTNATNQICSDCRGEGSVNETRQVAYKANIRWMNQPYDDVGQPVRTSENYVRTKMQVGAFDHIKESIGANVDGTNIELFQEPRKTGFMSQLLYVVAIWKVVDRNG